MTSSSRFCGAVWIILFLINSPVLFVSGYLKQGSSSAQLEIELISYKNYDDKDDQGRKCDFLDKGDPYFVINLYDSHGYTVDSYRSMTWKNIKFITFDSFIDTNSTIPNPLLIELPSGGDIREYNLNITIYDADPYSDDDLVAEWSEYLNSTDEQELSRTTSHGVSITFKIRVRCSPNYYGPYCKNYCRPQNTYICNSKTGEKICLPGYTGKTCSEVAKDHCTPSPCENAGTCVNEANRFHCDCMPGYKGKTCSQYMFNCLSSPPLLDRADGSVCHCPSGYFGGRCEFNMSDCRSSYCNQRGRCVENLGVFACKCDWRFTGQFCTNTVWTSWTFIECGGGGVCGVVLIALIVRMIARKRNPKSDYSLVVDDDEEKFIEQKEGSL